MSNMQTSLILLSGMGADARVLEGLLKVFPWGALKANVTV